MAAGELREGDLFSTHDGRWMAVEGVSDSGEYGTVYNLRVAEYHTYFVGCAVWGWSVWAHNEGCTPTGAAAKIVDLEQQRLTAGKDAAKVAAIDAEIAYFRTFTSRTFVEVQHVRPARGSKPEVVRTVFKNTTDFDGGAPAFVDQTPGAVHAVVKAKLAQGYTNRQLMQEGYAPIGRDGKPINLHHPDGTEPGRMIESTSRTRGTTPGHDREWGRCPSLLPAADPPVEDVVGVVHLADEHAPLPHTHPSGGFFGRRRRW